MVANVSSVANNKKVVKSKVVNVNSVAQKTNNEPKTIQITQKGGTFYLENEVKSIADNCKKKQQSIIIQKDKDIEKTKLKLEKQFKEEQEKYLRASEKLKRKNALKEEKIILKAKKKEEMLLKAEFMAREELCKKEILASVAKLADKIGWFEAALEMYKAMPSLFQKEDK